MYIFSYTSYHYCPFCYGIFFFNFIRCPKPPWIIIIYCSCSACSIPNGNCVCNRISYCVNTSHVSGILPCLPTVERDWTILRKLVENNHLWLVQEESENRIIMALWLKKQNKGEQYFHMKCQKLIFIMAATTIL